MNELEKLKKSIGNLNDIYNKIFVTIFNHYRIINKKYSYD